MRIIDTMSMQERAEALQEIQVMIESAIESEQDEPKVFKLETEQRIDLLLVNLIELFGIPNNS